VLIIRGGAGQSLRYIGNLVGEIGPYRSSRKMSVRKQARLSVRKSSEN